MSKIIILLMTALSLSAAGSCDAKYEDWSDENKAQYKTFLALQLIDTTQTWSAINCQKHTACSIEELNPILGSHPSKGELVALKLIGNYAIYKLLDSPRSNDAGREKSLRIMNRLFTVVVMNNGIQLTKQF